MSFEQKISEIVFLALGIRLCKDKATITMIATAILFGENSNIIIYYLMKISLKPSHGPKFK